MSAEGDERIRTAVPAPSDDAVYVTHGRHCPCSACAREDWTRITGPCGMHGKDCPRVYAPISPAVPAPSADPAYEDLCDHGCLRLATVQHADGRLLCKLCYLTEARVAPHGADCPTCGVPS